MSRSSEPATGIPCPDPVEWAELIADSLPGARAAALELHLDQCPLCHEKFVEAQAVPDELRDFRGVEIPPDEAAAIDRVIHRVLRDTIMPTLAPLETGVDPYTPTWSPAEVFEKKTPYRDLELIGRGGMGMVYKARHESLGTWVAIKILNPSLGTTQRAVRMLAEEARTLASLWGESSIVQARDLGFVDGHPYFVMEYLDGPTLQEIIPEKLGDRDFAVKLIKGIATALIGPHRYGLVHRDIKPANIKFGRRAELKILDFGIALLADGTERTTGGVIGTPAYMSPEQWDPSLAPIDGRTDLHALGCILYEILTGDPPFRPGRDREAARAAVMAGAKPPVAPPGLPPIPRDLAAICLKCLAIRPEDRYRDAGALVEDLQRFETLHPVEARPVGPAGQVVYFARRRPTLFSIGVSAVLIGLLATAFVLQTLTWRAVTRAGESLTDGRIAAAVADLDAAAAYSRFLPFSNSGSYARNADEWRPLIRREIASLQGDRAFSTAAGSPREPLIAAGDDAGTVTLWNPNGTDSPTRIAVPEMPGITTLAFSPGGNRLVVTCRLSSRIGIINVDTRTLERVVAASESVTSASIDDAGGVLYTQVLAQPVLQVHPDGGTGEPIREVTAYKSVDPARVSGTIGVKRNASGTRALVDRATGYVLFDLERRRIVTTVEHAPVRSRAEFSDDGTEWLVVDAGTVTIRSAIDGSVKREYRDLALGEIGSLRFVDSDDFTILTGSSDSVDSSDVWRGGGRLGVSRDHREDLPTSGVECRLGPHRDTILAGLRSDRLVLWKIASSRGTAVEADLESQSNTISFARDRPLAATVGIHSRFPLGPRDITVIRLVDAAGRDVAPPTYLPPGALCMQASLDAAGRSIAFSVTHQTGVHMWLGTRDEGGPFRYREVAVRDRSILGTALAPDGSALYLIESPAGEATSQSLTRISLTGGPEVSRNCPGSMSRMAFSRDGRRIALGSDTGVVRVFRASDLATEREFTVNLGRVSRLNFSEEGDHLALAFDVGAVTIHDLRRADPSPPERRFSGGTLISGLRLSWKDRALWVAAARPDDWLKRFDLDSGTRIGPRRSVGYTPRDVVFSWDGDTIGAVNFQGLFVLEHLKRTPVSSPNTR